MINQPEVTFIICTYNRADYLRDTLRSLLRHNYRSGIFEILIIDNNSTDLTAEVSQKYIEKNGNKRITIRYVKEKKQGLSHARNRGIMEATAQNVVFVDDDIRATKEFIPAWHSFFSEYTEAEAAGGRIHVQFDDPRPAWMSHFLLPLLGHHDLGDRARVYPRYKYPFGGNMGFRKELFENYGLFDTDLGRKGEKMNAGEEKELFQRLREHKKTIWYLPDALLYHRVNKDRLTVNYIKKQAIGLGKSMRLRLQHASPLQKGACFFSESGKLFASLPLGFLYLLLFQLPKARMLFKFRWWIWKGYFDY